MPRLAQTKEARGHNDKSSDLVRIVSIPQEENIADKVDASVSTNRLNLADSGRLNSLDRAIATARLRDTMACMRDSPQESAQSSARIGTVLPTSSTDSAYTLVMP